MRKLLIGLPVLAVVAFASWIGRAHLPVPGEEATASGANPLAVAHGLPRMKAGARVSREAAVHDTRAVTAPEAILPAAEGPGAPRTEPSAAPRHQEAIASGAFGPPPRVRSYKPGSLAHAKAVASNIASPEFLDTVSPLARLYFATFGRFPDYEGLDYYTGERALGIDLLAIADEFAASPEFLQRYGSLDNAAFVERILANVGLDDAAERAHWTAQLDAGHATRGGLIVAFSENGGFQARIGPEIFVSLAYIEALRRTPDPQGFARWVAHLRAGRSPQDVINALVASR